MGRTGTTRRGALLAAAAAAGGLLTACTGTDERRDRPGVPESAEEVWAAQELRAKSTRTSRELLRLYDAVLERHPDQAARLTPLRGAVAQHVTALASPPEKDALTSPSTEGASPSPSLSSHASSGSAGSMAGISDGAGAGAGATLSVAAEPGAAIKALAAAERRTADDYAAALVHAPPEFARLLASLAAACAAHAYLLTEGAPS